MVSACICRQSGSLTLGNVKCAMNLNSVLTKCSRDPVNSPSGGVCTPRALWQVPASRPREGEDWEAYLQPPLLPGAFQQGKGCCYCKEPSYQSRRSHERSLWVQKWRGTPVPLALQLGARPRYGHPTCYFETEAHFFWQLCQLRQFLLLVPVAMSWLGRRMGLFGCMLNQIRDWPGANITCK